MVFPSARSLVPLTIIAAGLLLMVPAVAVSRLASAADTANEAYTIDVDETGFTPATCNAVDRPLALRFRNAGATPRRVVIPDVFVSQPPLWDSGLLQPGAVSNGYVLIWAGRTDFSDYADPSHRFSVFVPVVGPGAASCVADPVTTAPGDAAGPPATVAPVESATPGPAVARCRGWTVCRLAMVVASDH